MNIKINNNGELLKLTLSGNEIKMREDQYAGPSIHIYNKNESEKIVFEKKSESKFSSLTQDIYFELNYITKEESLLLNVKVKNNSNKIFEPTRLALMLGVDNYMSTYPKWDDILFPTLLRCEKTHFWSYMMSPNGEILTVHCEQPLKSWKLKYNKLGDEGYNGHRIFTTELDLLNCLKQPERNPDGFERLLPSEEKEWNFVFNVSDSLNHVVDTIHESSNIPFIELQKYTLTLNEPLMLKIHSKNDFTITIKSDDERKFLCAKAGLNTPQIIEIQAPKKEGTYIITLTDSKGFISTAYAYYRKPWSWYLKVAGKSAMEMPQKATTHLEGWLGFHSAFLSLKHFPNEAFQKEVEEKFLEVLNQMYDLDTFEPLTDPQRIHNTGGAASILVDAYEATKNDYYLLLAGKLADYVIQSQNKDGSYRAYIGINGVEGTHYTAVAYPAKSILEVALAEKSNPKFKDSYERHFNSAKKAIDNLALLRDNIDTEGEITFEDGMITCSALQLGMLALLEENKLDKQKYIEVSKYLIDKHQCLEQIVVPDCRTNGGSLRFWESQYDILLDVNMMNSPHGWTSWKTYATWYLYLNTGEEKYLRETMDTLGACMQTIDIKNGLLRWGFIGDPCVEAGIWLEDPLNKGRGYREKRIIGEQYMDMISGWWRTIDEKPVGAYLGMPLITPEGHFNTENIGGSCDNDVHEHFKCLEEVAITSAYIIIKNGAVKCWNCSCVVKGSVFEITPLENIVTALHVNTDSLTQLKVNFASQVIEKSCDGLSWIFNK